MLAVWSIIYGVPQAFVSSLCDDVPVPLSSVVLYIMGCSSLGCCLEQRAHSPRGAQLSNVAAMLHLQPVSTGHALGLQLQVLEYSKVLCQA